MFDHPDVKALQPLLSCQAGPLKEDRKEELERLVLTIERRLYTSESKLTSAIASVQNFSSSNNNTNTTNTSNNRNNNNTDTDQILAKKEFQHILQKYGKREERRRKLFKAFSQDVRQLSKTTDSLLDAEQETMTIPDIDCNFSDLNQTLDSLKSSYEEHLISLCSQWILKEVKVQLLVIDSVSKIVKKNTSSITEPVKDEKAVDGQEIHQGDAEESVDEW